MRKRTCLSGGTGGVSNSHKKSIMYQRHKLLKRVTILFLLLSVGLWTIRVVQIYWNPCKEVIRVASDSSRQVSAAKGVELLPSVAHNVSSWFGDGLRKTFGHQSTVQSACNATSMVGHHLKLTASQYSQRPTDNSNYFATLTAIGELHSKLGTGPGLEHNAAELLSGISPYIQESDEIFTSLASVVSNSEDTSILSSLRDTGVSLVSLASEPISQMAKIENVRQTTRALEAVELKWFGLNAKKHHVMTVRGQRIGFVAFCTVHGMCVDSAQLPFGPVKYNSKMATSVINELKAHGVSLIIVLVYWGRRTSSFPDEMALPVARHLASLGVDVIVGYHPNGIQGHAYMGKTLILFSLGHVLSSDHVVSYCWNKVSNKWQYSKDKDCQQVQPAARDGLLEQETHTSIYRIHISNSEPAIAEYVTLPMTYGHGKIRRSIADSNIERQNWTTACGERDTHCLSCDHF